MRLLILVILSTLLTACASSSNYYTKTMKSWEGSNIKSLVRQWGEPHTKIVNPNGHSVYIYRTQTYGTDTGPTPTQLGVNVGRNGNRRGKLSLTCLAIFNANANGVITHTEIRGNGCKGSYQFAREMTNPAYYNAQ